MSEKQNNILKQTYKLGEFFQDSNSYYITDVKYGKDENGDNRVDVFLQREIKAEKIEFEISVMGDIPKPSLEDVMNSIKEEVLNAESKWPPMNSAHEAYAVLSEEVDELWDHVKTNQKRRDLTAMRNEAIQVAAMAVRFIRDICDADRGRK